ncbi:MAG: elongation factor G, partial [Acidobacteriota bacterium]
MQVDSSDKIRNLALAGHNDTGKTTLASALAFTGGITTRLNRVEDGNTFTDFDKEEIERGISIGIATSFVPWRGHKINLIDCPGYGIFFTETRAALCACDAVLLCVNGVAGVEVNTEKVWQAAAEAELPVAIHLAKMDRERADLDRSLASLQKAFGRAVLPIQLPIGKEAGFSGVIDLVRMKAYRYAKDGNGKADASEIPAEQLEEAQAARAILVEAVAEADDELMMGYFEQGTLSQENLERGIKMAIAHRQLFPLLLGAPGHGIGSSALLDAVVDFFPSPVGRHFSASGAEGHGEIESDAAAPLAALVFKTLSDPFTGKISILRVMSGTLPADAAAWNSRVGDTEKVGHLMVLQGKQGTHVPRLIAGDIGGVAKLKSTATGDTLLAPTTKDKTLSLDWIAVPEAAMSFAIEPKSKGDDEKIGDALHRLMDEDLTLRSSRDPETHEILLSGTGQLHIEIAVAKLKNRYHVEVNLHPPKVPYRETITKPADGHGRHKKQSGGRGQFADCKIKIEPMGRGEDFAFVDEIFGGAIPQNYRPAVEKGIQEARRRGYLAGYPVVDFRVRLLDGQYHDVDSSELAFKIAGSLGLKDALAKAGVTLTEPIMKVEIDTPDDFTGDVMGDLSHRRGRPSGMETTSSGQMIKAQVPMAEMLNYAPALRSMTQGRASFHMEFSHYEEVPRLV